jgi:hypothetical protein
MNYWTGVGSRETPEPILEIMSLIGKKLTDLGWVMRSGDAPGADSAFYAGCLKSENFGRFKPMVYLAGSPIRGRYHDPSMGFYNATLYDTWEDSRTIALRIRGSWIGKGGEELSEWGKGQHTRNVMQVLGHTLIEPSRFLICWAIPVGKRGLVKGGTGTAVKLALEEKIDVINLATDEGYNRAMAFIDS